MRYIVWLRENGRWVEQGEGPMGPVTAARIAREIQRDCGIRTRALPVGYDPNLLEKYPARYSSKVEFGD